MMTLSVIMPVYNTEKYVKEAIQSVLDQTYGEFELIIVDDGSKDNSLKICRSFTDTRIKIIQQENMGLPGARNTGIEVSQGIYIAFIDSDDMWHPEKLAAHVKLFEDCPDVGLSYSFSAFCGEDGKPTGLHQMQRYIDIKPKHLFCSNLVGNGSTAVIRRAVLKDLTAPSITLPAAERPFDEELLHIEDYELWNRILLLTDWKMLGIPRPLTYYRLRDDSISSNTLEHEMFFILSLEKIQRYAPEFVRRYKRIAMAHFRWYLARLAVQHKAKKIAFRHCVKAILTCPWAFQVHYPLIFFSVLLLNLSPRPVFLFCEKRAMALFARYQRRFLLSKNNTT